MIVIDENGFDKQEVRILNKKNTKLMVFFRLFSRSTIN